MKSRKILSFQHEYSQFRALVEGGGGQLELPVGEFQALPHPIVSLPLPPFYTHPTVLSSGSQNSVVSKQDISYCFFLLFMMGTG